MLFLNMLIIGTLISISSYSWFAMWIGLEMNLLSFIPLMNDKFSKSSEASLKYFIIQAISSTFILFSILMMISFNEHLMVMEYPFSLIMNSAFLTKMGTAPFHFWFPEIIEGLSWMNCMILLTWQKIAPMVLVMYNFNSTIFFSVVIILTMVISGVLNWNQLNLKKFLAFSSMNHMGWMLSMIYFTQSNWIIYFLIYSFITIMMISLFYKLNIQNFPQLILILNENKNLKLFFFLNLFSLGGLPPFLGFFPKWLVLKALLEANLTFLAFLMIFATLIMLYSYVRLTFNALTIKTSEMKMISNSLNVNFTFLANFLNIVGLLGFSLFLNY
uniref:NADH-ubiquinone oxidoreductase chain 2 n=1 Tax=Coccinellidae sp. 1 EF-2015 TaxID=1756852 RepID=A0A0S2M703_9CUCU|nr:NADH deshydrogenase subunit 2 [Coccinellidae sp. 1 EF-2015]